MSMVKVIEVTAQSEKGWEEAAQVALREASKSVRGIQSIWVKDYRRLVGRFFKPEEAAFLTCQAASASTVSDAD